jgi:predicted GNAT family N-acyltransferase
MPKLYVYPQAEMPAVYKWQAIAFMRTQWPSIFRHDSRFMAETYPPERNPVHFVVAEGDALVSYAAILRLTLIHAGKEFTAYGLGNMFTFPPYRGEGHGWRVLEAATGFIQQSDVDLAALLCDPALEAFYSAAGWSVVRSPTREGTPLRYTECDISRMMLFVSEKGRQSRADFEELPLYVDWTW